MGGGETKGVNQSFTEKVHVFSRDYLKCCLFILGPGSPRNGYEFTKKLFSKLIGTSQVLEDFLDFHGAKNNKDWYPLPGTDRRREASELGRLFPEAHPQPAGLL